jgi:hypothetical protein
MAGPTGLWLHAMLSVSGTRWGEGSRLQARGRIEATGDDAREARGDNGGGGDGGRGSEGRGARGLERDRGDARGQSAHLPHLDGDHPARVGGHGVAGVLRRVCALALLVAAGVAERRGGH